MAVTQVRCPHCETSLKTSMDLTGGKQIRCPKCQEVFRPKVTPTGVKKPSKLDPDEEEAPVRRKTGIKATSPKAPSRKAIDEDEDLEDERPARKSKRSRRDDDEDEGGSKKLLIGLLIGGGVAAIAAVVLVLMLNKKSDDSVPPPNQIAQRPDNQLPKDGNPAKPDDKQQPKDGNIVKPDDKQQPRNDGGLSVEVLDRTKKATVFIKVKEKTGRQATGSGFFSAGNDLVLTNAHVVGMLDPENPPPTSIDVVLDSGLKTERAYPASIVTVDRDSDLAVVRVSVPEANRPQSLDILKSATLRETQKVYVIGYPFGEALGKNVTVSESSVSSLRYDQYNRLKTVQVNGGMHPGNSGGPVIDTNGNLVGVAVAGIRNTQINMAVPSEHVLVVLRGRIAGASMGEAVRVAGQVKVNQRISFIDPLRAIKSVGVDWWFGNPVNLGETRPPSDTKPAEQPGDGPRTTTDLAYKSETGVAESDLPLGTMPPPGKVLWTQPRYVDGNGQEHWVSASPRPLVPPIDAEPAQLTPTVALSRSLLDVRSASQFRIKDSEDTFTMRIATSSPFWEDVRKVEADGRSTSYFSMADNKFNITYTRDNKVLEIPARVKQHLASLLSVGFIFNADKQGATVSKTPDYRRVKRESRAYITDVADQLGDSLDLCLVPLPVAVEVAPGTTWNAKKRIHIDLSTRTIPGEMALTYTYRGTCQLDGVKCAIIAITGQMNGIAIRGTTITGQARGQARYDLEHKRFTQVNIRSEVTMRIRSREEELTVTGTLESNLKRGPASSLPAPETLVALDPKVGGGPVVNPTTPPANEVPVGPANPKADARVELKKLEGKWQMVRQESDGSPFGIPARAQILIEGDKFSQIFDNQVRSTGRIVMDPTTAPPIFDVVWGDGRKTFGIYRLTPNGELEICMTQPGATGPEQRPAQFTTKAVPGKGSNLYVAKKAQGDPSGKPTDTGDPNADPKVELQKFQGRWQNVNNDKIEYLFEGQIVTFFYNGNKTTEGRFVFDPTKGPCIFDLTGTTGKTSFGIYRFTPTGQLEICMNQPIAAKTGKRPTQFSTKLDVGSGSILYLMKKIGT